MKWKSRERKREKERKKLLFNRGRDIGGLEVLSGQTGLN